MEESLTYQSSLLKSLFNINISKQGLDCRINDYSVSFLKRILEDLLKEKLSVKPTNTNIIKNIRIKDSTQFKLPDFMSEYFPGYGGSSPSVAKIQFEYSFNTGKIYELSVTNARENDMRNANETIGNIGKGDLIVRDLGYVSTAICKKIQDQEGYFVNRLQAGINIYNLAGKRISIKSLKSAYTRSGKRYLEQNILIGSKEKFPVRLIISAVSEEERLRRQRKHMAIIKHRKRKGVNEVVLSSKSLNLFITNIPRNEASSEHIINYYKLRWQIELIFKTWKSIYKINEVKSVKVNRFLNYLYSTLIWVLLNWESIMGIMVRQMKNREPLISLQKSFKMINSIRVFINFLIDKKNLIEIFYERTMESWLSNGISEARKNRVSINKIVHQVIV